ncbi:unnamed protein product, partial [Rotaria sp. Silwood1]
METQIRKINEEPYENPTLVEHFTDDENDTSLNVSSENLTDQDIKIVAGQLKIST